MALTAETLISLARAARESSTQQVLDAVADTLREAAGFRACVVNVYRPAWDDFEAVVVKGSPEVREALAGRRERAVEIYKLLAKGEERVPGLFFIPGDSPGWDDFEGRTYTPRIKVLDHPDAWRSEDALVLMLRDTAGRPLGLVTLDEPITGMRPGSESMELMRVIVQYAEQALEGALQNHLRSASERVSAALLRAGSELGRSTSRTELHRVSFQIITDYLQFERAAVYATRPSDPGLKLRRTIGWDETSGWITEQLEPESVWALLTADRERAGCWLLKAAEMYPDQPGDVRSRRNGRGLHGWNDHCLVAPGINHDGTLRAVYILEDPEDHAIPGEARRRAVRVMADQAAVATSLIDARDELLHLAHHDPLTGLRNRRGLDDEILRHDTVAVLLCDIDHFKSINDRHGHVVGDNVLRQFGDLLRELLREDDVAIRIGGEEFCLVLPHTDRRDALDVAERLRVAVEDGLRDAVPGGVTVSIGVAAADEGSLSVNHLLAEADRGVYAAKRTGRNRVARDEYRVS